MENFIAYNPTRLHFGKGVIKNLIQEIKPAKKILLVYGKGSIKKNGIYDQVINQLNEASIGYFEYSGIKSNPVVDDVINMAELGKKEHVEAILAVGGGSVIDSSKIAALAIASGYNVWDIMKRNQIPTTTIPLVTVLTLAATGTEMNGAAVLQNHETKEKIGHVSPLSFPKASFLDPEYTYSVSKDYTAYGIADLMAHSLEAWFGEGDAPLSDRFVISILQEAMEVAGKVLKEPDNYDHRARVMWAATNALNGLTNHGRKMGDWGVHGIGHTLSFLYDSPHGASLSIAYPAWLKLQNERIPERINELGTKLFGSYDNDETIHKLESFFKSIDSPIRLQDIGLNEEHAPEIVQLMNQNKVKGYVHDLSDDDHKRIVDYMLGK